MERMPVTSSNLGSIGYDLDIQTLEVEFNDGSVYQYTDVPQGEYDALMSADSKGTYFNANIRNRYPFTRL